MRPYRWKEMKSQLDEVEKDLKKRMNEINNNLKVQQIDEYINTLKEKINQVTTIINADQNLNSLVDLIKIDKNFKQFRKSLKETDENINNCKIQLSDINQKLNIIDKELKMQVELYNKHIQGLHLKR